MWEKLRTAVELEREAEVTALQARLSGLKCVQIETYGLGVCNVSVERVFFNWMGPSLQLFRSAPHKPEKRDSDLPVFRNGEILAIFPRVSREQDLKDSMDAAGPEIAHGKVRKSGRDFFELTFSRDQWEKLTARHSTEELPFNFDGAVSASASGSDAAPSFNMVKSGNDVPYQRRLKCLSALADDWEACDPSQIGLRAVLLNPPLQDSASASAAISGPGPVSVLKVKDCPYEADGIFQRATSSLNESQRAGVRKCLEGSGPSGFVTCLQGPPGTGKTTTLVALLKVLTHPFFNLRVLCCAPSNTALDNLLEKFVEAVKKDDKEYSAEVVASNAPNAGFGSGINVSAGSGIIRLGHPTRASPVAQQYLYGRREAKTDDGALCLAIRAEIELVMAMVASGKAPTAKAIKSAMGGGKGSSDFLQRLPGDGASLSRREIRAFARKELKLLWKELREREKKSEASVASGSRLVFATCSNAASDFIARRCVGEAGSLFDFVVVDEAGQATEVDTLIPVLCGKRVILAGDAAQLPPTVVSEAASDLGLGISLLERLTGQTGQPPASESQTQTEARSVKSRHRASPISHMLKMQYRMNEQIMNWSSNRFYDGLLRADATVANHTLSVVPVPLLDFLLPNAPTPLRSPRTVPGATQMSQAAEDKAEPVCIPLAPLVWIDTAQIDDCCHEVQRPHAAEKLEFSLETSSANLAEAEIIVTYINAFCASIKQASVKQAGISIPSAKVNPGAEGVAKEEGGVAKDRGVFGQETVSVGVVTPYAKQVKILRLLLEQRCPDLKSDRPKAVSGVHFELKVSTVDGFQGQEADAIILSLVRSNEKGEVGFLDDHRRINVAVTRAKKHLVVVGDSSTVIASRTLNSLFRYFSEGPKFERTDTVAETDSAETNTDEVEGSVYGNRDFSALNLMSLESLQAAVEELREIPQNFTVAENADADRETMTRVASHVRGRERTTSANSRGGKMDAKSNRGPRGQKPHKKDKGKQGKKHESKV